MIDIQDCIGQLDIVLTHMLDERHVTLQAAYYYYGYQRNYLCLIM